MPGSCLLGYKRVIDLGKERKSLKRNYSGTLLSSCYGYNARVKYIAS